MIPITRPLLGEPEAEAARRVILSGWTTQGPEVAAFEREFASVVGAEHACAVANCTVGLHLVLLAAGVGPGDEVVTVSHSFIATANAIRYCGATPVFVDIESKTFNIDAALVEQALTPRTKAIVCVHQLGMPCDLATLLELARRHGVALIEDAACAAGSEILLDGEWQRIGRSHADAACFSFHPRKIISTGDGGMITTRHAAWDRQFRLLRQHGMDIPDTVRHSARQVSFESYPVLGYNYRMTDIQAAVGRAQLRRLPEIVARRRLAASRYHQILSDVPGLALPRERAWTRSNWQSYCVRLPPWSDQTEVMQAMLEDGVSTRRGVMCAHRELPYAGLPRRHALSRSEEAQDRCILLPLYPQLTDGEQEQVGDSLRRACRSAVILVQ